MIEGEGGGYRQAGLFDQTLEALVIPLIPGQLSNMSLHEGPGVCVLTKYRQVPLTLEFFTLTGISLYIHRRAHLPWRPHVCTLYQILYALTYFREWSVPDSGSWHTIEGRGVWWMTIPHRHRLQITDTVFL